MIPKECKRLAEVDFPIAEVSRHSAREKSIRHGHPSTLHLWWARRPLAACRSMLMALLLPDPCDANCPEEFKTKARTILLGHPNHPMGWDSRLKTDEGLRKVLLKFIADFANWDHSSDRDYLKTGRALVATAHPDEPPLVVDPFAGGGSIPLEALRLGCEAFASDLNPVACLLLKVMLEDIPRYGPELAEELRRTGKKIKEKAEKELVEFYPKDPDGATPIAYLWARTVKCESPNCGAEIPLMRSFWLCKKATRSRALRYKVVRPNSAPPKIEFEIFKPINRKEVPPGTMTNGRGKCLCCGAVLPPDRVREQLSNEHGGVDVSFNTNGKRVGGAKILAVVTRRSGKVGASYRLAVNRDYKAVWKATRRLMELDSIRSPNGLNFVPDEPINPIRPSPNARGLSAVTRCGMRTFGDLFTARQKLSLLTLARQVQKLEQDRISDLFGAVVSRCADYSSSGVVWAQGGEFVAHTFGRQALPIVWDFAETVLWADASGSMNGAVDWVARVVEAWQDNGIYGQVHIADASESPLPDDSSTVWFTDPPYYDAIPYADLSDYFLVWLKRALPHHRLLQDPFNPENPLSPKLRECVWNMSYEVNGKFKDGRFFEKTIARSFREGYRVLREDGVGCVVFAHKTTEGWEALLSGMIKAGWVITCSWPIATERAARLRARESASLATSVHLVCRPRPEDASVGDWADVLRELPKRVGDWMERLQEEGIRGADLVFACIGPALEIFSCYSKVVDPEEREIPLGGDPEATEPHKRGYLSYVWEVVGRMALEQVLGTEEAQTRNGAAGALEEDARLTALFLWTLQSTNGNGEGKGYSLVFDVARRFAQPLGIDLPKWENRIIKTEKGVVRLLPVSERADQLFGKDGARAMASRLERSPRTDPQLLLFPEMGQTDAPKIRGRGRKSLLSLDSDSTEFQEATTLDRVHAAMLLQAGGQPNALRALVKTEQDRGPEFLRLANALSALYPKNSEEKRLLDAMLLAVPR